MQNLKMSSSQNEWVKAAVLPNSVEDIWICAYFCIIGIVGDGNDAKVESHLVLDYEQVMMICDTLSARAFTLWYNSTLIKSSLEKMEEDVLLTIYNILDEYLMEEGNDAYRGIGMYEAVCLSILLDQHEDIKRAGDFLVWVRSELINEKRHHMMKLLDFLEKKQLSAPQLSELHGLFRHWGHPTVHEELGCEKTRIIGQTRSYPDCTIQRKMVGLMNRQFYSSFLSRHGRPPRIDNVDFFSNKPLGKLLLSSAKGINIYSPEFSLLDWGYIKFQKEFEFDYNVDYTELMEDKDLSPLRSEFRTAYNPGKATTSRRVLEEVLNNETVDVKGICEAMQTRTIPEDWKIIMIHAKERELKEAPRMFAMLVFQMRIYFCVTEMNLAKILLDYFPQQTMTLDESELIVRDPRFLLGLMNEIDFSNWNLGHTSPLTVAFFAVFDQLFGTPGLFSNTHWFFEECMVVLSSYLNPPPTVLTCQFGDPPACNELWYHHAGGFEGLRQEGWTIITISLLLFVEHLIGMKSYILGQGDNQVCKVLIPVPEEYGSVENYLNTGGDDLDSKIKLFLSTLTRVASLIGLMVKPDETAVSRNVVIYGKDILVGGSFMPQGLKRISRTLPDVNEIYPTLETKPCYYYTCTPSGGILPNL